MSSRLVGPDFFYYLSLFVPLFAPNYIIIPLVRSSHRIPEDQAGWLRRAIGVMFKKGPKGQERGASTA